MALPSAHSCSNSKFRTYNSRKSTLDNMSISKWIDVLSKLCQALQQEVPQATKPFVHLQINQFELQVQKEEEGEEKDE